MIVNDLGPGYIRTEELYEWAEGTFSMIVDTDIELSQRSTAQMKHIGADLYVPHNIQAFNISVKEAPGLVIAGIELNYSPRDNDFIVSSLILTTEKTEKPGRKILAIDGGALKSIPIERYKRKVIECWVLRDRGEKKRPRWRVWNGGDRRPWESPELHSRGGNIFDLQTTARIYAAARYGDKDSHEAVAENFGISKSTAGRWIKKARDAGYIDRI